MEVNKVGTLIWRAEPLPWKHGSNVMLNVYGTGKMSLVFVMDYQVRGHPDRMAPFITKLLEGIKK